MQEDEDSLGNLSAASQSFEGSIDLPRTLHALANKLLPIVAFSDLGVRNAKDPLLLNYFQKIRHAAGDARDLIVSLRQDLQEWERNNNASFLEPISDDGRLEPKNTNRKMDF